MTTNSSAGPGSAAGPATTAHPTVTADAAASGTWLLGGELPVHRLGFGSMRLPGRIPFDNTSVADRDRSIEVLRRARDLGVNHIDTAAFYFSARLSANELINTALAPYPSDLVIATKVGPRRDRAGAWATWARPDELRGDVEENLRQLGRDHLDVVNLRVNEHSSPQIAEHVGALAELRDAGLIRYIGVSNVDADALARARAEAPIVCVQNRFSLDAVRPGDAELLTFCATEGIAFVPFFAIAGEGGGSGTTAAEDDRAETVADIATAHGVSTTAVRLAWTLHQGPNVLAIPGTGDPEHLAQNVSTGALRLTDDELSRLSA